MTYEEKAQQTLIDANRKIRDEFQAKHPHYTPPPESSAEQWESWRNANVALHGIDGFNDRFPEGAFSVLKPTVRVSSLRDAYLAAAESAGIVVRLRETYPKPPRKDK